MKARYIILFIIIAIFSIILDFLWTKHSVETLTGKKVDNLTIFWIMNKLEK